jgi:opacity protein-like surface antigen
LGAETSRFDVTFEHSIIDPIIGARRELGLTDWLSYKLRSDIGGFGIDQGTTSNFAWNVETGLEFHLGKWLDLDLGYRWLDYNFKRGSSVFDLPLNGPYMIYGGSVPVLTRETRFPRTTPDRQPLPSRRAEH